MTSMFKPIVQNAQAQQPVITPPPTMPDPFGPASAEAAKLAAAKMSQGGRSSTILSNTASRSAQTFAGGSGGVYGSTKLG